jgi:hypothetical protein
MLDAEPLVIVEGRDIERGSGQVIRLLDAVKNHSCLVIFGNVGAGKTASLQYLAQSFTPAETADDILPIAVELGRYRIIGDLSPLECILVLIGDVLHANRGSDTRLSLVSVLNFLSNNKCIVLLDGLNEVSASVRKECMDAIVELSARCQQNRYVLTTRFIPLPQKLSWPAVSLRDLNDSQISEFVRRYCEPSEAVSLLLSIRDTQNSLLRVPLFLKYASQLWTANQADVRGLVASRSGLVSKYIRFLLKRDSVAGQQMCSC